MFWKFISRWALVAVAAPVAAAGVRKLGSAVEARRGSTPVSRLLGRTADTLQAVSGRRRRRWR